MGAASLGRTFLNRAELTALGWAFALSAHSLSRLIKAAQKAAGAETKATLATMKPAPITASFFTLVGGTPCGRRAPLFNSCIDRNRLRIIAAASLERRICAK